MWWPQRVAPPAPQAQSLRGFAALACTRPLGPRVSCAGSIRRATTVYRVKKVQESRVIPVGLPFTTIPAPGTSIGNKLPGAGHQQEAQEAVLSVGVGSSYASATRPPERSWGALRFCLTPNFRGGPKSSTTNHTGRSFWSCLRRLIIQRRSYFVVATVSP